MKNFTIEIKWAIIFSVVSVLWIGFENFLGWHDIHIKNQLFGSYFFLLPSILIYVLAIKDKKINFFSGMMSWQQGMVTGVYLSFFIALLSILVQIVCFEFITPHFFENMIKYMLVTDGMTLQEARDYFNLTSYVKQGVFGSLSMGVVTSSIVAYFMQTKK